jgi:signal transduction histidine kinase
VTRRVLSSDQEIKVSNTASVKDDSALVKKQPVRRQSRYNVSDKVTLPGKQQPVQLKRASPKLVSSDFRELLIPTMPLLGHLIPGAESCVILLFDPTTHQLSPVASVNLSQDFINLLHTAEQQEGLITAALDQEEPYLLIYLPGNKHFETLQKPAHREGIRTLWLVPWHGRDGNPLGVLLFASGQAFSPDKQAFASTKLLTEWMSASLQEVHVRQMNERLNTTIDSISDPKTSTGDTQEITIAHKVKKQLTKPGRGQTTEGRNGKSISHPVTSGKDTQSMRVTRYKDEYGIPVLYNALMHEPRKRTEPDAISVLSHELLSPLTLIKGYAATMLQLADAVTEEQRMEYLQRIGTATDKVIHLMENLRDISRFEVTTPALVVQPTSLLDLLRNTISEIQSQTTKHVIELRHFDPLPLINVDRQRIEQVMTNLLVNAVKHSPNGCDIEVIVWQVHGEHELKETLGEVPPVKFPCMIVSVTDTGIGIPEEELERIFERFYRVDNGLTRATSGAGLGLYISKVTVEAHGGHIWANSELQKGNTFTFSLPVN